MRKPKLGTHEQISCLKARGVTFDLIGEEAASRYLKSENNLLRVCSYRIMFDVDRREDGRSLYRHLDFAMLADLAGIDRMLREVFLLIILDVEHFAKTGLLGTIGDLSREDGYGIVSGYMRSLDPRRRDALERELHARCKAAARHDLYTGDLIARYEDEMPVWVFLEVVSFGVFLSFCRYCALRWDDDQLLQEHYILRSCKSLRNALAHNCCIINGFTSRVNGVPYSTPLAITRALNEAGVKNTRSRRAKLSNPRMNQIGTALYAFDSIVKSEGARARGHANLERLRTRFELHHEYYASNNSITSFFDFLWKLVDIWG